jgi:hypothetical protein
MKNLFFSSLLLGAFCCSPVLAEDTKAPAKAEAATPEVEKAVESFDKFDPQTYTCADF